MKRKMSPNSLKNLEKSPHTGRIAKYGDRKRHEVFVSDQGWEGSQAAAKQAGFSGISEMLEELGRGRVAIAGCEQDQSVREAGQECQNLGK